MLESKLHLKINLVHLTPDGTSLRTIFYFSPQSLNMISAVQKTFLSRTAPSPLVLPFLRKEKSVVTCD